MMKEFITGLQHIGLPTANMDATTAFYKELGFEVVYETINEANGARVAFLKQTLRRYMKLSVRRI